MFDDLRGDVLPRARTSLRNPSASGAPRAWQRMLSGRRLDLLDPSPMDIEIEDIAHGLARVARWNGQTRGDHAFSVAQHSLVVEGFVGELLPSAKPIELMSALLHDAAEYVIGDMISPFKNALGGDYRAVEDRLDSAIRVRFGLPARTPPALKKTIKAADHSSAFYEATRLAGFDVDEAIDLFGAPNGLSEPNVTPLSPGAAQSAFVARFDALLSAMDTAGTK